MSKPKVWTLPELLDRIWSMSRGKRTAVATEGSVKRTILGWDADFKPCTYELNKISAASAAALYERIKFKRREGRKAAPRIHYVVTNDPGGDLMRHQIQELLDLGWTMRDLHILHEQCALQEMILYPEDAV